MKKKIAILSISLILSACFDGSDSNQMDVDTRAPDISALAEITIVADTDSDPIIFTVEDNISGPGDITLILSSSDPEVISDSGLAISSNGNQRMLLISPVSDRIGTSTIAISATDSSGNLANTSFIVSVIPREVSEQELIDEIIQLEEDDDPVFLNQVSIGDKIDNETGFDALIGE